MSGTPSRAARWCRRRAPVKISSSRAWGNASIENDGGPRTPASSASHAGLELGDHAAGDGAVLHQGADLADREVGQ